LPVHGRVVTIEAKARGRRKAAMGDIKDKLPDQKELERELNEYLSKKYGDRIKLGVSMLVPKAALDEGDGASQDKPKGVSRIQFNMKPEELEAFLDEFVVKQKKAKEVLATKICTHFNRIRYMEENKLQDRFDGVGHIKNNILMIGPTGVGKTYIIKLIAKKLGVPFVKGDATKFSETGYVGGDVEDLVRDLVHEADGDIQLAQYGIIYIDEIDKIASSGHLIGPDVSRAGVQRALLKPMEETDVDLRVPHDPISIMEAIEQYRKTGKRERKKVNTKNILFIVSGAFYGLEDIIKRRLNSQGIGFTADIRSKDDRFEYLQHVKAEDLIEYGFESEFVGRLPVIVVFDKLDVDDLYQILRNPNSPIIQGKKRDFKAYGIDIRFSDGALRKLAERAHLERTGARGLVSSVEKVLLGFEKKLPSTTVTFLAVTEELVDDPEGTLQRILEDPDNPYWKEQFERCLDEERKIVTEMIRTRAQDYTRRLGETFSERRIACLAEYVIRGGADIPKAFEELTKLQRIIRFHERRFYEKYDLRVTFDEGAVDRIAEKAFLEEVPPRRFLEELLDNCEPGLRLIHDKTGQDEFILTAQAVDSPEEFLSRMIKEYYARF
jgi:ATP-dependent Clp protease ATP-binding subunit ClpX